MEVKTTGFLKKPLITGAAALAIVASAFGAGVVLAPHQSSAQAIRAEAPKAASGLPSFADLVERVAPAVVAIEVVETQPADSQGDEELQQLPPELRRLLPPQQSSKPRQIHGGGSGFFISGDGYIVTNNHVVDNATSIRVTLKDGREMDAKVIGRDVRTDLAVIKVEGNNYPYVQFEPNTNIRVGDWVIAIGNPFGLGGTATAGIVSALGRENVGDTNISDFIQIDAPINPGNSGGPTFDMMGRVIGVNTAIVSGSGGNVGIGFAIPASTAERVTQQIISSGHVTYGWLGVSIQDLNHDMAESFGLGDTKGAIVGSVNVGSPADKAGIKRGDIILTFNGIALEGNSDLTRRVGNTPIGTTVKLGITDALGKKRTVNVTILQRPSEKELAQNGNPQPDDKKIVPTGSALGMKLAPLSAEDKKELDLRPEDKGLMISSIDSSSDAGQIGLQKGDALLSANGVDLASVDQLNSIIAAAKASKRPTIGVLVQRGAGGGGFIPLPIK